MTERPFCRNILPAKITKKRREEEQAAAAPRADADEVRAQDDPTPAPDQRWKEEAAAVLAAFIREVDVKGGFDLPAFIDDLKRVTSDAVRQLIKKALEESGWRYPQAAEWLQTTPRVLRYLYKEKN